jgi:hypothetical protein
MLGFTRRQFQKYGTATFNHFAPLRDTLFVCSEDQDILLVDEPDVEEPGPTTTAPPASSGTEPPSSPGTEPTLEVPPEK